MLNNFIIISLIVLSFITGLKISDRYHEHMNQTLWYFIRYPNYDEGVGYVPPPQPESRRRPVLGREFYDKLKKDGKAVQQITTPSPN